MSPINVSMIASMLAMSSALQASTAFAAIPGFVQKCTALVVI